jgi:hypothetical protein
VQRFVEAKRGTYQVFLQDCLTRKRVTLILRRGEAFFDRANLSLNGREQLTGDANKSLDVRMESHVPGPPGSASALDEGSRFSVA